ncbi:putative pentatricopeptide repeat-containing protein [Prunus yedoensis var. nudiflora]|uniref:Putative pentatricopeptide repeat-containing protein n=1 Tax=Prunus yedoensis var. nudiflora TaxID=2094558 RepID=A0A314ZCT7_PRUYE|nr:putative pentatricopeptide repeat-containing protein [Prunus yedoensis var. nudiflora]
MFSRCGLVGDGFRVFDEMPDRNLVTWTLMISAALDDIESAKGVFESMTNHVFSGWNTMIGGYAQAAMALKP